MRIYEFSKEKNISTKKLIELLREGGFAVKSHMSVLEGDARTFLENALQPKKNDKAKASEEPIKKEKKPIKAPKVPKPSKKETKDRSVRQKKIEESLRPKEITSESKSVGEAAQIIGRPVTELIVTLLKWGIVATKNQIIAEDVVVRIAEHYDVSVVKPEVKKEEEAVQKRAVKGDLKERIPVVVVVGHVDHGKTTLLDFIRKTRVAAREKGGITQHLGVYEASTPHGNIIFLDTPGHEAFGKIRQRGIKVADIVILVVAANDGVMPQTVEAIKHAKSMHVPIIVAINKMDKVDESRIEVVKRQLSQHDVLPEEWGGDVIYVPISAKMGTGINQLLEMVILQAQMMELRASTTDPAKGFVLESKLERGRGPVATIICQHGEVNLGDYFVCGKTSGHISSMVDSYGRRITKAGPVIPVQVAGFEELPSAGDYFEVVSKEDYRKAKSASAGRRTIPGKRFIHEGGINLIIKADTDSSKEALIDSIDKLSKRLNNGFNIIYSGVGDISEGNVEFAFNTGSQIVGLHVKTETNATSLAQRRSITIMHHDIIYKLLESLEARAESIKEIEMVRTKIGEAFVLRVFDIKKIGVVAGSYVKDGRFSRDGYAVVFRDDKKVGEGKITSLQREKKVVKEVHAGYECGFIVEGFSDWQVDDRVECYLDIPKST